MRRGNKDMKKPIQRKAAVYMGILFMLTGMLQVSVIMTAAAEETEAAAEADVPAIGVRNSEADYAVMLENQTGMDILSVKIRVDRGEYGEELLADGEVFEAEQERILYCTPKELAPGAVSAPVYDIRLGLENGETAVIHTFPFGDANSAQILYDDEESDEEAAQETEGIDAEAETEGVEAEEETEAPEEDPQTAIAYLIFTSISQASEHNTLQHERDTLHPPVYDNSAYTDYSYTDYTDYTDWGSPDYTDYSYTDYSYTDYSYDGGSYSEPVVSDGGGGDDQCITDGVIMN